MMMKIVLSGLIGLVLVFSGQAAGAAGLEPAWKDLDQDGFAESQIFYGADRKIEKIQVYSSKDRKLGGVIYYQDGNRNRAMFDRDGDGRPDKWISYAVTGEPWKIVEDRNGDGRPDYWAYFQNNRVYRWAQDRNGDGKPDVMTVLRDQSGRITALVEKFDDDFDGFYDRVSGRSRYHAEPALNARPMPETFIRS